jgi:hypothetical protein
LFRIRLHSDFRCYPIRPIPIQINFVLYITDIIFIHKNLTCKK